MLPALYHSFFHLSVLPSVHPSIHHLFVYHPPTYPFTHLSPIFLPIHGALRPRARGPCLSTRVEE